jgi:N-glycosylase/DNA lyase
MNTKTFTLLNSYFYKKHLISERLEEFREVLSSSDERIFAELSFCICTPQSKAFACWKAISNLANSLLLYHGSSEEIKPFLKGIRFPNVKAKYIVDARNYFTVEGCFDIKDRLNSFIETKKLREYLVKNVKGIGMKEASHFLRNIGLGEDLAILDRHIIRNLVEFSVIQTIPKSLTNMKYLEIELLMKDFSEKISIPMDELDLLFWSDKTGFIFK